MVDVRQVALLVVVHHGGVDTKMCGNTFRDDERCEEDGRRNGEKKMDMTLVPADWSSERKSGEAWGLSYMYANGGVYAG